METSKDINFSLCVDGRDFLPGRLISSNICSAIVNSQKIIFVVTRAFIKSYWCRVEVDMAQNKILDEKSGKIIIVFLEDIPKKQLPRSLRRLTTHVTHITWPETPRGQSRFWKRLKLAMQEGLE
jgi:hypothetical protein